MCDKVRIWMRQRFWRSCKIATTNPNGTYNLTSDSKKPYKNITPDRLRYTLWPHCKTKFHIHDHVIINQRYFWLSGTIVS